MSKQVINDGIPNDIGRWSCVRCKNDFIFTPYSGEAPYAFEINADDSGWQTQGGDICMSCYKNKPKSD